MRIAMLRVGIDTGCGGIHGPLFKDGTFEYIPIPDGCGIDRRTYGNTFGRSGKKLVEYFPKRRQEKMSNQPMHVDPEFDTFTYGDPTRPKAGLCKLEKGDMLVFYCGLCGWDFEAVPALYLMGYFEIEAVGKPSDFSEASKLQALFGANFHVRHKSILAQQYADLVLVKGSPNSRLLTSAVCISVKGQDRAGRALHVLSPQMQEIFGNLNGKISIQRSPTRRVQPDFVPKTAEFVRGLE